MPQPKKWLDEIIDVLMSFGGEGYLRDIYREISNRGIMDLSFPTWHNTVRSTIELHSSDTQYFFTMNQQEKDDIFYAPKGLGAGYWALRPSSQRKKGVVHLSSHMKDGLDTKRIPKYWIEKTIVTGHPMRQRGNYAVGQALVSPARGKDGRDIYRFMRDVKPGDIVIHLTDNMAFTGVSEVESSYQEVTNIPGTELANNPSYIVRLHNFRPLNPTLTRQVIFTSPYKEQLLALLSSSIKNLFYNQEPNLNQGAYLTPAPLGLVKILNDAYHELTGKLIVNVPNLDSSAQQMLDFDEHSYQEEPDELLDDVILSEKELLEHVKKYISASGYYFDEETIYNYHICLKTRPFVILAGLSGTGKSKLAKLYAAALGHTRKNGQYLRLPVRPSWNDDRYLLGYFNFITGEYVTESALEFLIQAEKDEDNLYFLCLDEMNLAHVEYYFSQFLSAMEEDEPDDRGINLFSARAQALLAAQDKNNLPRSVLVPTNLLFTGTVNVDETTQPLSDKVMDRANTIEFYAIKLDKIPARETLPQPIRISSKTWHNYQSLQSNDTYRSSILRIAEILGEADMGIGYRVVRDIELYLANSEDLLKPAVAFDLQVKQRILPHVRGTKSIEPALNKLLEFMQHNDLTGSAKRLEEMKLRLERDGYVNYWR